MTLDVSGREHVLRGPVRWEGEADVVVVGSGIAGSVAALTAASRGASVVVLEKAAAPGGTFAKSAGAFWIPRNRGQASRGVDDDTDDALRFIACCARPEAYDPDDPHFGMEAWEHELLSHYIANGEAAVEALEALGALTADFPEWAPDYQTKVAENTTKFGRLGLPMAADGSVPIEGRRQAERFAEALGRHDVKIQCQQSVDAVVVDDDGVVVGVRSQTPSGPVHIGAAGGVVFGSGGFSQDRELRRAYLPGTIVGSGAVPTNTGDFVRIVIALGAPLHTMTSPWMAPIPLELVDDPNVCPVFVSPGDSMVYLNRHGLRVVNEKAPYNEVSRIFGVWDPAELTYPNLLLFMVFDQRVRDLWAPPDELDPAYVRERWPLDTLGNYVCSERVVVGDDLPGLAAQLEDRLTAVARKTGGFTLDPGFVSTARSSIDRFNAFARGGADRDFQRGETPIEQVFFGEARAENDLADPMMYPLSDTGPYYALILGAGTLDSKGGPRIDVDGRVLGGQGRPIPGLYGAGNCVASAFGRGYPAGGTPNGSALIFGHAAGRHAADRAAERRGARERV